MCESRKVNRATVEQLSILGLRGFPANLCRLTLAAGHVMPIWAGQQNKNSCNSKRCSFNSRSKTI